MMVLSESALNARKTCPALGCRYLWENHMPEGWPFGRRKTEQLLIKLGFRVQRKSQRVVTTKPGSYIVPNLLHGHKVSGCNQVWVSDMTYYTTKDGTRNYLIFIADVYSQKIIAHGTYIDYPAERFLEVLNKAISSQKGVDWTKLIHHSDRGSQYGSNLYTERLAEMGIKQSMAKYSWENPLAEKVNDLIKNRYLVYWEPTNTKELKRMVGKAVYNHNRYAKKKKFGNKTPIELEKQGLDSWELILKPLKQYEYKLVADPETQAE